MKEKELERLNNLKEIENKLHDDGIEYICGIDEAGRGPLAGPVVVAAVIMPKDSMIEGVNDSKKVSEKKREALYDQITNEAIAYAVGIIDQKEIDEINILNATKKGLNTAIKGLKVRPRKNYSRCIRKNRHRWNSIYIYNKGRCKVLFNCCSIYNCKSYKG